jgi:homoserine kinase
MSFVRASAPASSANLGPAFDAMAIALELRCAVDAAPAETWKVEHIGPAAPDPDADDAVLAAARVAVGADRPLHLVVDNHIPLGRGLGSSSAAFAAGALAAWKAVGETHAEERLFEVVAELEGHPDNAAAAVYGGLVLTTGTRVHRLPWNPFLHLLVAVPSEPFATRHARQVLPSAYSRDIVVRSVARTASLVAGLLSADGELLRSASGDELHEAPRAAARPDTTALVDTAVSAGAYHACWSGAGPSVLAIVAADAVDAVYNALAARIDGVGDVLRLEVATTGAA